MPHPRMYRRGALANRRHDIYFVNGCFLLEPELTILMSTTATLGTGNTVIATENQPRGVPELVRTLAASRAGWASFGLIAALIVALYLKVWIKLVHDWINIPDYSHGLLIPFFVAFLIWEQRESLMAAPVRRSWAGVPLVAIGLIVLLGGVFGADLFLSRISLILLAIGLIWTLLGREMLKRTRFMMFVLFLAIPFPAIILNQITFPLQILASTV